jgi:hypothetical protein
MRRFADFLLVLILLGATGVLFFVLGDRMGGVWFATPTPTARILPTRTATPPALPSPARSLTSTSTPAVTATRTVTASRTPTSTATTQPSETAAQEALNTPPAASNALADEINAGIQTGDQIVDAVEAYRLAEGQYPFVLEDLVPVFLPEIPVTGAGQEYYYRPFEESSPLAGELYWVAFKLASQEHATCTYLRRLDFWDCNFASP